MRIYLTSVEESHRKEEIQEKIQSLFPECSVVVIPNKYATIEGRQEVRKYAKEYYEKNKERILAQKKEREYRKKAEKEMNIIDEYCGITNKQNLKTKEKNSKKKQKER